jgi:hypothetical protein
MRPTFRRIPPCPNCGHEQTVATTIYEPADTPENKFVVHCPGCGLSTGEKSTWSEAIDDWISLVKKTSIKFVRMKMYCTNPVCHQGFSTLEMYPSQSLEDIVQFIDDCKVCPDCGQNSRRIRSIVISDGDTEYELPLYRSK